MHSNTTQNNLSLLRSLASKIYLEVGDDLLRSVSSYLDDVRSDLDSLSKLDVSSSQVYYVNPSLKLSLEMFENQDNIKSENQDLLEVFVSSYEFTNIQSQE